MKRILFLTSTNLITNPRLLKELRLANDNGYSSTVIKFNLGNWSQKFENDIVSEFKSVNFMEISALRKPFIQWLISITLEKASRLLPLFLLNTTLLSYAVGRRSYLILKCLKKINEQFNLVVAHNPESFYPAVVAAKKFNAKLIFDFEDFHRGEFTENSLQSKLISKLERSCISSVSLITTASPAISEAYQSIFPEKSITTINNVFPISYVIDAIKVLPAKPLKLFWFSQYIGKKRGLENIIQAIASFTHDDIQLTLLGSCSNETKNYFSSLAESVGLTHKQLIFLGPIEESQIVQLAAEHHIGLASEPGRDLNNELALSNKIMIYLLAGNALVASKTKAQNDFLKIYNSIGLLYEKESKNDVQKVLRIYLENPELLHQHRNASLQLAKTELNWDIESIKWLNLINHLTD
jgi:glycosyltransferase involved in cell wall biosynthesis